MSTSNETALIIDAESAHSRELLAFLKGQGLRAYHAETLSSAETWLLKHSAEDAPALVIGCLNLEKGGVIRLAETNVIDTTASELIVMGDDGEGGAAGRVDRAMADGAGYFFTKPFDPDFLKSLVADVVRDLSSEGAADKAISAPSLDQFGMLRGNSKPMRKLFRNLRKIASSDISVLVVGESGTGKELVAKSIHSFSERTDNPFLAINCGAIPENLLESELFGHEKGSFSGAERQHIGLFEQANGGSLFLDEITEMPMDMQVRLLRVLQEKKVRRVGSEKEIPVDVRIIAATNRSPASAVEDGRLREDLYYRVAQVSLHLPPLRSRAGDKVGLAQHFLNELNNKHETRVVFTEACLEEIAHHSWPGNVRELENSVERAYLLSEGEIGTELIQDGLGGSSNATADFDDGEFIKIPIGTPLDEVERNVIMAALEANDGNKKVTAEVLGISLKTLYNRLNAYESKSKTEAQVNDAEMSIAD